MELDILPMAFTLQRHDNGNDNGKMNLPVLHKKWFLRYFNLLLTINFQGLFRPLETKSTTGA